MPLDFTNPNDDGHDGDDATLSSANDSETLYGFSVGEESGMDLLFLQDHSSQVHEYIQDPLLDLGAVVAETADVPAIPGMEDDDGHHFTTDEYGPVKRMRLYDEKVVSRQAKRSLLTSLRPRQFFIGDILHRERSQRKVSWDELFMDLCYIGVMNRAGNIIRRTPDLTASDINHYLMVLGVMWYQWLAIETTSNRFGMKGFTSRVVFWVELCLTIGLGINSYHVFDADPDSSTFTIFVVTQLALRLIFIATHLFVFIRYPKFGPNIIVIMMYAALGFLPYFLSIFIRDQLARSLLWWLGFLMDTGSGGVLIVFLRMSGIKLWYRFAVNIEHHSERLGAMHLVILGEIVVSLLFASSVDGISEGYGITLLGLGIVIALHFLYYNIDSRSYMHPIRRSAPAGLAWQWFHVPCHLPLAAAGCCLYLLIQSTVTGAAVPTALRVGWIGGLAVSLASMGMIALCHKAHDHDARAPRKWRVVARFAVAAGLAVVAVFSDEWGALALVLVPAGAFLGLVVFEEFGRLEKPHHHHAKAHPYGQLKGKRIDLRALPDDVAESALGYEAVAALTLVARDNDFEPPPCMRAILERCQAERQRRGGRVRLTAAKARRMHGVGGGAQLCGHQ